MNIRYNEVSKNNEIPSDIPFIKYFKNWIVVNKEDKVSQSTLNRYFNALKIFDEKFGQIQLKMYLN